jgi:two-component system response regulator HydG
LSEIVTSTRPNLADPYDLVRSLESPLRLRLVAVLVEAGSRPSRLEDLVVRSGRHVQDVLACLRPLVQAAILEEGEGGKTYRFREALPREVMESLRAGLAERGELLGRERDVRERVLAGMIGVNPKMQLVFEMIRQVARIDVPVLITGETGTGKELVARAIHDLGSRRRQFFGAVNCATLSELLFESQVFGHVRGAFTGANRDQVGLIERCDGGTLFLDELGELSTANQVKLLRVLQDRTFTRLGETTPRSSDFRLLAATHRDLTAMVAARTFREDLYYRVNVFPVRIPSLRERLEDLPYLVQDLLRNNADRIGATATIPPVRDEAIEVLKLYNWPGNVRELENVVLRAAVMAGAGLIGPDHLPALHNASSVAPSESAAPRVTKPLRTLAEVEREHVELVVRASEGNLVAAAKTLGISRTTLYKKLADYGIET